MILACLDQERVDAHAVVQDRQAPTGVALVMVDTSGEKQILTAPGANRMLTVRDLEAAAELAAMAKLTKVVLLQLEVPLETVEFAIRIGKAAGARIVLDPAPPRPLADGLLRRVDVIRPNAAEAEVLTGIKVIDRLSARKAAENLIRRGVGAAIIGAPGGDLVVSPGAELWLPHLPVEVVDTTGAGDAFAAALAVYLACGEGLEAAAHFANAAAALKATKLGAQAGLPRREEVLRLLRRLEEDAPDNQAEVSRQA